MSQQQEQQDHSQLETKLTTEDVLNNTRDLVSATVEVSLEEYRLLEKLNLATANKYEIIEQQTLEMYTQMSEVQPQLDEFAAEFGKIDELYDTVKNMEKTVTILEKYLDNIEDHITHLTSINTNGLQWLGCDTSRQN